MFEIELHEQVKKLSKDGLAEWLWRKLNSLAEFSKDDQQALFWFLLSHGFHNLIIEYTLDSFTDPTFEVPWPYFLEALTRGGIFLNSDSILHLKRFMQTERAKSEAARTTCFDEQILDLPEWRQRLAPQAIRKIEKERLADLDQLLVLRTQQLFEKEKEFLNILQKKYPLDESVKEELRRFQERYAEEIILKHKPRKGALKAPRKVTEGINNWRSWSIQWLTVTPGMADDIITGLVMMEMEELALEIWQRIGNPPTWLGAQLLLMNERFIELIALLPILEQNGAADPETFFASSFLRAQAFWGLGQKTKAIEILEALLVSKPDYRYGRELLQVWRSQP